MNLIKWTRISAGSYTGTDKDNKHKMCYYTAQQFGGLWKVRWYNNYVGKSGTLSDAKQEAEKHYEDYLSKQ